MNKNIISAILLGVLFSKAVPAFTISGYVHDAIDGVPLDSAKIEIISEALDLHDVAYTDQSGNWNYTYSATDVRMNDGVPRHFRLYNNYPNPFNPSTTIGFETTIPGEVQIFVTNVIGQTIDSQKEFLQPGRYHIQWESRGSAGVYFYTIQAAGRSFTGKMLQLDSGNGAGFGTFNMTESHNEKAFLKNFVNSLTLITSKFGYVADTMSVDVASSERIDTPLETVHARARLIDLHNDVLYKVTENGYHLGEWHHYNHTDIPRMKAGGIDVQFLAIWISPTNYPDAPFQRAMDYVDDMHSEFAMNADDFQQALNLSEALQINDAGKIAGVMAVEGGHSIENSLDKLITLYHSGMRYMTITWNNSTDWAVSAQDARSKTVGLSKFGKQVIETMDSLGVIIDVSHTGIKAIQDILEITKNPIIASHSGVRAIREHYRNLYDEQIIAIANTNGVIGVVFYPYFLGYSASQVNISTVIQHIDYIVNLAGIDYVAIGSDFDGIEITPVGLEDCSKFPDLTLALLRHGYSREEIQKILGGNFMRVFDQVCR